MHCGKQTSLLLGKNYLLKRRVWRSTACEVLVPVLVILLMVVIRLQVPIEHISEGLYLNEKVTLEGGVRRLVKDTACGSGSGYSVIGAGGHIALAPARAGADNLERVQRLRDELVHQWMDVVDDAPIESSNCRNMGFSVPSARDYVNDTLFRVYESVDAVESYVYSQRYGASLAHAPVALAMSLEKLDGENQWGLTFRTNWTRTPPTNENLDKLATSFDQTQWRMYWRNGVLTMKRYADVFLMGESAQNVEVEGDVAFAPFPMQKTKKDNFKNYMGPIFGLFLLLPFMWPFSRMVRQLVDEKERRIKEGMKMMGLSTTAFWSSWYLTYLALLTIAASLGTLCSMNTLYEHSDGMLVWVFFMLFMTSLIGLGMVVVSLFNRAKTAGTISSFALFGLWLPYVAVNGEDRPHSSKMFASLLSPVAFSLGQDQFLSFESSFIGIDWSTMDEGVDNFDLSSALTMLFIDSILYVLLALYLDQVVPKEYGLSRPFYFPCMPSFWCSSGGASSGRGGYATLLDDEEMGVDSDAQNAAMPGAGIKFEPVPAELEAKRFLSIRKLRRTFQSDVGENVAVAGLDLDMYMGQIFVLLGHNGAGKSTTINMLTGMLAPSSGTARVENLDITEDMDAIRQGLGVCPQHDILFPNLTVEEHLRFFAKLKGVRPDLIHMTVDESIVEVQLEGSRHQYADALSGGQKRRLSLAIALIGDSQFVVLDEPTSGVDPFSRRAIWNLLSLKKRNKVIILTTHFMDEADQLGDRIGIMHKGKLKCVGSSLFLKRTYGVGYTMTLTKQADVAAPSSAVRSLIKEHVAECRELSDVGTELSFQLPLEASGRFPDLLQALDESKDELGVANYGLSVTTLEEVFIKVAEEQEAPPSEVEATKQVARRMSAAASQRTSGVGKMSAGGDGASDDVLYASDQFRSPMRDFQALLTKRYHIIKRDRKALAFQVLIPLAVLILGLSLLHIPPNFTFDSVQMDPSRMFGNSDKMYVNSPNDGSTFFWDSWIEDIQMASPLKASVGNNVSDLSQYMLDQIGKHDDFVVYGATYVQPTDLPTSEVSNMDFVVLSNITANHALPAFLTVADDAQLRNITGDETARIRTTVHPFSYTEREKTYIKGSNGLFASIIVAMAFSFVPASYVVFVVKDRENHSKHLQDISGVSRTMYWVSSFAWDYLSYLVPALLASFVLIMFDNPPYQGENYPTVLLTFLMFGLSVIPFSYMMSFMFESHSTAQNVMIMIYLLGGLVMTLTSFVLFYIPDTRNVNDHLVRHIFRLVPNFALSDTMFRLAVRDFPSQQLGQWDMQTSGYNFVYMFVEFIVFSAATLFIEHAGGLTAVRRMFGQTTVDPPLESGEGKEDEDVVAERRRIVSGQADDEVITVRGLRKVFSTGRVAVHDLYFSIPAGQCFSYLGVNGAGKTTSLRMLTGDIMPTRGSATLGGFDILEQPERVRRMMGYCPQFDALYEHMTAVEHLQFYGRIRGVPEEMLPRMIEYLVERLTLTPHAHRPAGTYSGGNKRKLSVGIALIGNPRVVFLDEPSTGMDPVSRRFMWDFISETMADRAVILTTHSMEECEALSQRIGILVLGRLRCIGSSQHLKQRYGRDYQLDISTGDHSPEGARYFVMSTFDGAEEIEAYGGSLKYRIPPQADLTLAGMFSKIEENKDAVGISEYSIGQTSLEQIFNMFAKAGDQEEQMKLRMEDPAKYLEQVVDGTLPAQAMLVPPGAAPLAPRAAPSEEYDAHSEL